MRTLTRDANEVMADNLAIYARLGYRETGRRTDDGDRRAFMEKVLPISPAVGEGDGGCELPCRG